MTSRGGVLSRTFHELRDARLRREQRVRHTVAFGFVIFVVATSVCIVLLKTAAKGSTDVSISQPNRSSAVDPSSSSSVASTHAAVEPILRDATGQAARLLASTKDPDVARSALLAAQDMTGCAPKEGGPALVHIGNPVEKAAERASRADFYETAKDNGREYATHARAYADRRTIVFVAVAWECT